jgi:hypothetical protein
MAQPALLALTAPQALLLLAVAIRILAFSFRLLALLRLRQMALRLSEPILTKTYLLA